MDADRALVARLAPDAPLPALAAYAVALVAWHLPGAYDAALRVATRWHVVEHLTLWRRAARLVAGPLALRPAPALPLRRPDPLLVRLRHADDGGGRHDHGRGERALPVLRDRAPRARSGSPLADQRLGGVIMWVPAGLVPLLAFTIVFFRWAATEADADERGPATARAGGGRALWLIV